MAMLSFASEPSSGTLTATSGPLEYTAGPFFQPNAFGNSIVGECDPDPSDPLVPCDVYRLTVTLPANYATTHPNQSVFVRVEWPTQAADFDLYLWDKASWPESSSPTGTPIAQPTGTLLQDPGQDRRSQTAATAPTTQILATPQILVSIGPLTRLHFIIHPS